MSAGPAPTAAPSLPAEWTVEWRVGSAGELHSRALPSPMTRLVSVLRPTGDALVLGSAQRPSDVDAEALADRSTELVRRRGGGGAVWLSPDAQLWIDVAIPSDDPLWSDDVGRAFEWLGTTWAAALGCVGVEASVHRRGLVRSPSSGLVCFAGLGPGEVHVGGSKLVGISQRRTRAGARFQSVVYRDFSSASTVELLALDEATRREVAAEVDATSIGLADVCPGVALQDLERAFLENLPSADLPPTSHL